MPVPGDVFRVDGPPSGCPEVEHIAVMQVTVQHNHLSLVREQVFRDVGGTGVEAGGIRGVHEQLREPLFEWGQRRRVARRGGRRMQRRRGGAQDAGGGVVLSGLRHARQ
jgi:hypothetical protein